MRALLLIAAVILVLAVAGWISFSKSPDRSSINLETQQIKQDTDRALESGSNLLREAGEAVDRTDQPGQGTSTQPTQPAAPAQ